MVSRKEREMRLNQNSAVFWLTGLSGSGKSTLAVGLEQALFENGFFAQVVDGDNIRTGINNNLGFSLEDREENIRRIAEVSKLYVQSGIIVIASFISPTEKIRTFARDIIGRDNFHEIYIDAPLSICEQRDVKGLYAKARAGIIKGFTGIDAPYEAPQHPHLHIKSHLQSLEESLIELYGYVLDHIKL
jgi:adenylylsulfate kinase